MINLTPEEIRDIIAATMLQHNEGKLLKMHLSNYSHETRKMDAREALLVAAKRIIEASSQKEYAQMDQWMRNNALALTEFQWKEANNNNDDN